jgi:hypothetical protein
VVEGFGFGEGDGCGIVSSAQFDQRGGRDSAFEMQVKFCLGEPANERQNIVHGSSLAVEAALISCGGDAAASRNTLRAIHFALAMRHLKKGHK